MKPRKQARPLLDREALQNYALRTLSARPLSVAELRQKLQERAADPADIDSILANLAEYRAVDDQLFAQSFGAARKQNRGFGPARVLRDLRQRKIAAPVAEEAVAALYAEEDESTLIRNYLLRKYRSKNLAEWLQDPKNLASAFRRLRVAGFSSSRSLAVLRGYNQFAEMEECDEEPDSDQSAD